MALLGPGGEVIPDVQYKSCTKCKRAKLFSEFHRRKDTKSGRASWCKSCCREKMQRLARDPEYRRKRAEWQRKALYGVSDEQYEEMYARQGGLCAVCRGDGRTNKGARLYVDHDHKTGNVRGLLCHRCNLALAWIETEGFVEAAQEYLGRG